MKSLSTFFYAKASLAIAIIFTILTFSYLFFVMIDMSSCFQFDGGKETLGMSFGLSLVHVQGFFSARTIEMVVCYKSFNLVWDNLFALLYGLMYTFWLSAVFKPFARKLRIWNLLPIAQMIFDWLENYMLIGFSNTTLKGELISGELVQIASVFSMAKWTISAVVYLLLLIGVVALIIRKKKS